MLTGAVGFCCSSIPPMFPSFHPMDFSRWSVEGQPKSPPGTHALGQILSMQVCLGQILSMQRGSPVNTWWMSDPGEIHVSRIKVWTHSQLCHVWGCRRKMGLGWWGEEGKDASCSKGMTVRECRERDTPACIFLLLPAKEAGTPGAHSFTKYLW